MAPALVRNHTSVFTKTAGTGNLGVNVSTVTTAGNTLIAFILCDNAGASLPTVVGIAKPVGETAEWVLLSAARSTGVTPGAACAGEMWAIQTTMSWPIDQYTVSFSQSTVMKATLLQEFSGATATMRSTSGTRWQGGVTIASSVTTAPAPVVGDLAVGFAFTCNTDSGLYGDTDTTGGAWSTLVGFGSTGDALNSNNYGLTQYKILTGANHQNYAASSGVTAGNGSVVAILAAGVAAPNPKIETLTDTFDTTIDRTKWLWASAETVWDAGRAKIPVAPAYYALSTNGLGSYDLTGSSIFMKVVPPPGSAAGSRETTLNVLRGGVSNDKLMMFVTGVDPSITAWRVVGGVTTEGPWAIYNPVAHAYWRIRESGGTAFFDTSPDGVTWTNFWSVAPGFNITNVWVSLSSGYWGTETAADAFVDNVNMLQSAPPTGGRPKMYVGGSWQKKPAKMYIGGAWTEKPMKRYVAGEWKAI